MPRNDVVLWLDLETTGSASTESIIEVGIIATDATPDLNELGTFQSLVEPVGSDWEKLRGFVTGDDRLTVKRMHERSGLTRELLAAKQAGDLPSAEEVEGAILHFVRTHAGSSTEHIPLGGSGVGHFDRQFIRRDWPKFDKRLTYWVYDVGVVRRMIRLSGAAVGTEAKRLADVMNGSGKPHRALDDTRLHVEEARVYLRAMADLTVAA